MSLSILVCELEGLSESDDYDNRQITPAWKIFKISWEDFGESLKSKNHTTIIETTKKEKTQNGNLNQH